MQVGMNPPVPLDDDADVDAELVVADAVIALDVALVLPPPALPSLSTLVAQP
jgi:hypothetical protein